MNRTIFLLSLLFATAAVADPWFVRAGAGLERSSKTVVHDVDCASTNPPALFGCGPGLDGRTLGARGSFEDDAIFELALGYTTTSRTRFELAVARRDLALDAEANFRGVAGEQPVHADVQATSALLVGTLDLAPASRVTPFISAGIGAARNEVDAVHYRFPAIDASAVTITTGGTNTDLAWMLAGGLSFAISDALHLDLSLRYTELGEVRTSAGQATILRPTRELVLDVDRTTMNLGTGGAIVSLRYSL